MLERRAELLLFEAGSVSFVFSLCPRLTAKHRRIVEDKMFSADCTAKMARTLQLHISAPLLKVPAASQQL